MNILILLTLHFMTIKSQQLSLIGSRLLSQKNVYKAFISAYKLDENSLVNVTLTADDEYEEVIQFDEFDGRNFFEEVIFQLPHLGRDSYELTITHLNSQDQLVSKQSVTIVDLFQRPIILIQTDKKIYSTGDSVRFRIIALTQKLLPFETFSMSVTITDSNDKIIDIFSTADSSLYEGFIKLSESPNIGKWNLQVDINGYKKLQSFHVQHKNDIQVDVHVDKVIAFSATNLTLNLIVRSKDEKSLTGMANISANGHFIHNGRYAFSMSPKVANVTYGRNQILIHFQHDLELSYLKRDMLITFHIHVVEDVTKSSTTVKTEVTIRHKITRDIKFSRNEQFRPGSNFPVTIYIHYLNGRPDNSFNQLQLLIYYQNYDHRTKTTKNDRKKLLMTVKHGRIDVLLSPAANTKKIILEVEYAGMEVTDEVKPMEIYGKNEFIQVTVLERGQHIGDLVESRVESSEEMGELHVMVIGSCGMIYSKDFPDAKSTREFNFTLKLTKEMAPESNVVVFYVSENTGEIVYDTFILTLGFKMENTLAIVTSETAKPSDKVKIHIKTTKSSTVLLKAVDADAQEDENEVTKILIHNEILKYQTFGIQDEFGKFNAFVMQPLISSTQESTSNDLTQVPEFKTSKFIPETWLFNSFDVDGDKMISTEVPDKLISWNVHGISIHPVKGLAVVPQSVKIHVLTEFSVRIYAPTFVHKNEIFKVEYGIFNYLKHPISMYVFIDIQNGDFMDENLDGNCKTFKHKVVESYTDSFDISGSYMSEIKHFLVRLNGGAVKVKITAKSDDQVAMGEKIVEEQLNYLGILEENLGETETFSSHPIQFDEILMLPKFDDIFSFNYGYSGYKSSKFTAAIISLKYLNDSSISALEIVKTCYQDSLNLLRYFLSRKNRLNLQKITSITKNLIAARDLITVDESCISEALEVVMQQQEIDGSFPYNEFDYLRRDIGTDGYQKYILTALVTATFLKDENFTSKYQEEVGRSINFLKNPQNDYKSDYEKVIVAYVLALYGDNEQSQIFIDSMDGNGWNSTDDAIMAIEIAAYIAMTKKINGDDPQEEIEWLLLTMGNRNGSFYSPYDIALAMEVLYEDIGSYSWEIWNKSKEFKIYDFPTVNGFKTDVEVLKMDEKNIVVVQFNATAIWKDSGMTNLIIIEAFLPSGYKYVEHSKTEHIRGHELRNDGNLIIFYITGMNFGKIIYQQSIKAEKIYEVGNLTDSVIKIYDYYRPYIQTLTTYSYDENVNICKEEATKSMGAKESNKKSWWSWLKWFG